MHLLVPMADFTPFFFAVWEIGKTILKGDRGVMDTGLYRFCAYIYFFQVI